MIPANPQNAKIAGSNFGALRPFFIIIMAMLFIIPLGMITDVVQDRMENRNFAIESVTQSWAGRQTVAGPVLIIPYVENRLVESYDQEKKQTVTTKEQISRSAVIIPETLDIDARLNTEERRRGIHKVPVYNSDVSLTGSFGAIGGVVTKLRADQSDIGTPYLVLSVSDNRGLSGAPAITLNGKALDIQPGSTLATPNGIHAMLDLESIEAGSIPFEIGFGLKGTSAFAVVPVGKAVKMNAVSAWPHPSFTGQFLPSTQSVAADGFKASWETGLLATNILQQAETCVRNSDCNPMLTNMFGVELYQPVDIYDQSMRAVKYGMLFVGLTFGIFYLAEIFRGMKVHAAQFLLVGGALAIFYLLLISLSEHIGFGAAYVIATVATCGLLMLYIATVLRARKGGVMIGGLLTALYVILYFILKSEDYALLMGSILLFAILAAAMYATRNVDWAQVGKNRPGPAGN